MERPTALTRRVLERLADPGTFARGEAYAVQGRVRAMMEHNGLIRANVAGTTDYRVNLRVLARGLDYTCNCPVGADGVLCKHVVAVGLAWIGDDEPDDARAQRATSSTTVSTSDVDEIKRAISAAGRVGGNPYAAAGRFAQRLRIATIPLEDLLASGNAADAVALAELALRTVERALYKVDDSDGIVGDLLRELAQFHHRACALARPEPRQFAKRLFTWEMRSEWDLFHGAVDTYADVLGDAGIATYRALASKEWARVPPVGPDDEDRERYGNRFRISNIMERLARQAGDVEAVVAVKARTLAMPYDFLQIAETYAAAGKHDAALEWAERGTREFGPRADSRLGTFLGDEYARRGRHQDALDATWPYFEAHPTVDLFARLKRYADGAGTWSSVRERAHASLRALRSGGMNSLLVELLLWEQRIDEAWGPAVANDCSEALWRQLAALRAAHKPDDAVTAYNRLIDYSAGRTNNRSYGEVIVYLRGMAGVLRAHKRSAEFAGHVERVRADYGAKRNLMTLLAAEGW